MGHPDGAGPVARARESHQLGSGAFHSLAEDSSLQAATPSSPPPIATNLRLICLPVRRYFKNLFVCFNFQERHNSWCNSKRGFHTLCKHAVSHESFGGHLLNTHIHSLY